MIKDRVIEEMKKVFQEVPYSIDHTLRVLENAEAIMEGEKIKENDRELISIAAILHDIGAIEAQRKHGSMEAHYQEIEGPKITRRILEDLRYDTNRIDRICYIVGNHHTPSKIDGIDFQILWEADLLENMIVNKPESKDELKKYIEENFKTATGKKLTEEMFFK